MLIQSRPLVSMYTEYGVCLLGLLFAKSIPGTLLEVYSSPPRPKVQSKETKVTHTENGSSGKRIPFVDGLYRSQVGGSVYARTSRDQLPRDAPWGGDTVNSCLWGKKASSCIIEGKATGGFWNFPFNNGDTNTFFGAIFISW